MTFSALPLSMLSSVAVAALYAYVGLRLSHRKVEPPDRMALRLFVVWWYALAAISAMAAIQLGFYMAGNLPLWLYKSVIQVALLLVVVAVWGLLYYLLYVYTGSSRLLWPLTVSYGLFYIVIVALVAALPEPQSLTDNGWTLYAQPRAQFPPWIGLLFVVFLIGPQLGACIGFIVLYAKVEDRSQRYRIALVSASILVWFGSTFIVGSVSAAGDGTLNQNVIWQVTSRMLGILAALTILAAYQPPAWVRRRFGIHSI